MSLLTKIVKSVAVVDDRPQHPHGEAEIVSFRPVLKRDYVERRYTPPGRQTTVTKQDAIDELNRIKVQVTEAKAELRALKRELEESREKSRIAAELPEMAAMDAEEAENKAAIIMETARREAEKLLETAAAEGAIQAEDLKNQGFLEGFNKGYTEAKDEYINENQPKAEQLEQILHQMVNYQQEMMEKNEDSLVQLVLAVAAKVIYKEIATTPETIAAMLYETLDANKREEFIKITLSKDLMPVDAKVNEKIKDILISMGANISVYTDGDLEQGSCIVETPKGLTDISISTQLNNIGQALCED